jgi:hypothetical protein
VAESRLDAAERGYELGDRRWESADCFRVLVAFQGWDRDEALIVREGGKAAGPWRLIDCLAEHEDNDQQWHDVSYDGESFGDRIGPVFSA